MSDPYLDRLSPVYPRRPAAPKAKPSPPKAAHTRPAAARRPGALSGPELERLLFHMPACVQRARSEWMRDFAADMAKRAHWPNFKPTQKQIEVMQGMVDDLFPQSRQEFIEH